MDGEKMSKPLSILTVSPSIQVYLDRRGLVTIHAVDSNETIELNDDELLPLIARLAELAGGIFRDEYVNKREVQP